MKLPEVTQLVSDRSGGSNPGSLPLPQNESTNSYMVTIGAERHRRNEQGAVTEPLRTGAPLDSGQGGLLRGDDI